MNIVRFKAEHLQDLKLQKAQAYLSAEISGIEHGQMIESSGESFTVLSGGKVLGCGGCIEVWKDRAVIWALISKDAGRSMSGIHKAVVGYLSASKYKRIEAWVDEGFEPGVRWLELLGFICETPLPMRGFRPDGGSCFLFSKVK